MMDAIPGHAKRRQAQNPADSTPKLDLLQVMGPNTDNVISPNILKALSKRGLNVACYGDGTGSSRNKLLKRLISEALGASGHLLFSAHGGGGIREHRQNRVRALRQPDGSIGLKQYEDPRASPLVRTARQHSVRIDDGSQYGLIPTASLLRWVHDPGKTHGPLHRMAHLISCSADETLREIRPGSDEWKAGYTVIYGGEGLRTAANNATSVEMALDYVAECSEKNQTAHPLVLFARAGLARGDALTLIGGDLEGPVSFSEPTRLSDLQDTHVEAHLSGSAKDVMRIRVALALDRDEGFKVDLMKIRRDYVFTRVLRRDAAALREAIEVYPELRDATDQNGYSLLQHAVQFGHEEIVRLLLESGAKVDQHENPEDMSPLMEAARAGNREMVDLLLEFNADPALESDGEIIAADYASSNGHSELASYLLARADSGQKQKRAD